MLLLSRLNYKLPLRVLSSLLALERMGIFFSALHHAAQMDESIKITRHLCNCFRMHEIQLGVPFPVAKEDIQVALEGVCKGLSPSSQQQQIKT